MKIAFVEIQNFRKLQSCRIEFGPESTIFVGANNSGKTSAMTALKKFLKKRQLVLNDFTMTNFIGINRIGNRIIEHQADNPILPEEWLSLLPTMDVWLDVKSDELRYVAEIIPTLDWTEGKIGIRLMYEPKDYEKLYGDFAEAFQKAHAGKDGLKLWPTDFCDYLSVKLPSLFTMNAYILNPANIHDIGIDDTARPQMMPAGIVPLGFDPFKNLIRVDIISAQRGLDDSDDAGEQVADSSLLSEQLRSYYDNQLDPEHEPSASDMRALKELQGASEVFNQQISKKFHKAMKELSEFGYPGKYNPNIIVETKTKAGDVLSHNTTVRYPLLSDEEIPYTLPEQYNGLGYQNLISMSFKLMSFRDSWMNGNRRNPDSEDRGTKVIPPIHLVLIEEPEAHLHTQVQQVFIKNAYKILRNHSKLKSKKIYTTQLIVTTHSSYIALESKFENLRYFRRTRNASNLPTSVVINLNTVFGSKYDEAYLKFFNLDGNPKVVNGFQQHTKYQIIKAIYAKFLSVPEAQNEDFDFLDFIRDEDSTTYNGKWCIYFVKRDFSSDLLGMKDIGTGKIEFDEGIVYEMSDEKFIFNLMNFPIHSCFEMTNLFDILRKKYKLVAGVGKDGGYHAQILMSRLFSQAGIF